MLQRTVLSIIPGGFGPGSDASAALHGQILHFPRGNQRGVVPAWLQLLLWSSGRGAEEKPSGAVVALSHRVHSSGLGDKDSEQQPGGAGSLWTSAC